MACEYPVCGTGIYIYVPFVLYGLKYCIYVLHILRTYFWYELNVWILGCQVIPQLSASTSNAKVETNFPIDRRTPFSLHPLSLFFSLPSRPLLLLLFSSLLSPLSPSVSISPSFPLYNLTSPSFLVFLFFSFHSLFLLAHSLLPLIPPPLPLITLF